MNPLHDESGFTLTELLVAMTVGIVVLFGALGLLETTTQLSAKTTDRVEATAGARRGMDLVTRQLRSQVCLSGDAASPQPALIEASPTAITFYASLAPESATLTIQKRTVEYLPGAGGNPGRISETVLTGTGIRPDVDFSVATPVTRTIVDRVVPDGATPIFRYYKLVDTPGPSYGTPALITAAAPLPLSERQRTAQIEVNFAVRGRKPATLVALSNKVYVRTANPTKPELSPVCL